MNIKQKELTEDHVNWICKMVLANQTKNSLKKYWQDFVIDTENSKKTYYSLK